MSLLLHSKYLVSWKTEALGNALHPEILKFSVNSRIKPGIAHSLCVQEFIESQIWVARTGRGLVLLFWNRERFWFPKFFPIQVLNEDVLGKDRSLGKLALVLSADHLERCGLAINSLCVLLWLIIVSNPTILNVLMDGYFFYLSSTFNKNLKAFFFINSF